MSDNQIDENDLQKRIDDLNSKLKNILTEKSNIEQAIRSLQSVKKIVASITHNNDGSVSTNYANPIDVGTGSTMTDARRLEIFNSILPNVKQILGS